MKWRVVTSAILILLAASLTMHSPSTLKAQNKDEVEKSIKQLNEQLKAAKKETADLRAAQLELVRKLSSGEKTAAATSINLARKDEDIAAANKALAECREENLDLKAQVETLTSRNTQLIKTVGEHETVVTSLAVENAGIKKNIKRRAVGRALKRFVTFQWKPSKH